MTTLTPPLIRTRLSDQLHPHGLINLKHLLTPSSLTVGVGIQYTDFEGTRSIHSMKAALQRPGLSELTRKGEEKAWRV